jgi:DNA replication protein DnaC
VDLKYRPISNEDLEKLYENSPQLNVGYEKFCPTCLKKGTYKWKDQVVTCDCQQQLQLHKQYLVAGIGNTYQRLTWDDFHGDEMAKEYCQRYLKNHEQYVSRGVGVMFTGPFGAGKTMASTLLLKDLMHLGYSVYSTTFTGMIDMFTAGWNSVDDKRYFEKKMKASQILLLDDVGKEFRTKNNLSESTFDNVLRYRVQHSKPTFITTNMTHNDMAGGYGSAIFSLLFEAALDHEFIGGDFRKTVTNRTLDEIDKGETRPIS